MVSLSFGNLERVEVGGQAHRGPRVRVRCIEQELMAFHAGRLEDLVGEGFGHGGTEEQEVQREQHGRLTRAPLDRQGFGVQVIEHTVGDPRPIANHGDRPLRRDLRPGQPDAPLAFRRPGLWRQAEPIRC